MKKYLKLCVTLLGLVSLIVFSSCENFLKGAQIKSEIEAAIAYANAPSYTITVDSGDNSGVVKSPAGGEAAKKVTDIFSVKFEPYADYEFLYWKIIDSTKRYEALSCSCSCCSSSNTFVLADSCRRPFGKRYYNSGYL